MLFAVGCKQMPHTSIASIGGREEGIRIDQAPDPIRVQALTEEIKRLDPSVSPQEAETVARTAVYYSEQLADQWHMVKPVELHNVLVNIGLRPAGLCFQYADCLQAELRAKSLKTLDFERGIAWRGDVYNEHNCVVVKAVGHPFETGIVLDGWRNAGHLRYAPVLADDYPWKPKNPVSQ